MLTEVQGPTGITVHLLSQIDGQITGQPIGQQASLPAIEDQANQVAHRFAAFVNAATTTLDVCIYDFRLVLPDVSDTIVAAINGAAGRGVTVRVAYDANEASDTEIIKQFQGAGGDPAPTGTQVFITQSLHPSVHTRAVAEETVHDEVTDEPIAPGSHIMHHKYMVADAATDAAAVWTGSTNFTVDAWALQENNIVVIASTGLAAQYTKDFDELWTTQKVTGTGGGNEGSVNVGGVELTYAFAPGEGSAIETLIAQAVAGATTRLRVASMVTSSPAILTALKGRIDAGINFAGVYDEGETQGVISQWKKSATGADKVALAEAVLAKMVAKDSQRFDPSATDGAHNFMHDKVVVADDTLVTGSFNFSANAAHNAENVLSLEQSDLADAYAGYVDGLVARYRASATGAPTEA
jgi:phosphatidylserine/phosphatidylglycerophosphate/cardiolipin synthase-like enzyme